MERKEKPVSIHYAEDGEVDGILVKTLDESFIIALHDADNGKSMTWNEAMEKHKDEIPTKKQALIICAYIKDINNLLALFGGDKLDDWYWTNAEYYANYAWLYGGVNGCLIHGIKCSSASVRPVLASD